MSEIIPQKYCPNCQQYYPPTLEFFHQRNASRDGLNHVCKTCNKARASAQKMKRRKEKPPKEKATHCTHGHPLVEGNLRRHNGYDECLTCHRERERLRQQGKAKGETAKKVEGYCTHGHPLVEGNLKMKHGKLTNECLTCHRESANRRYHKDPQRMAAEASAYAKSNRDKINKRMKEYRTREIPKLRARASSLRRRAKKFEQYSRFYENMRLYEDEESQMYIGMLLKDPCAYCGGPMESIDHIVPLTKGGSEHWTNLTSSCKSCNSSKNNKSLLQFFLYKSEYRSANLASDFWVVETVS